MISRHRNKTVRCPQYRLTAVTVFIFLLVSLPTTSEGQDTEDPLNTYLLYYNSNVPSKFSLLPRDVNGRTIIPRNINPLDNSEKVLFVAPFHIVDAPLKVEGKMTARFYASGQGIQRGTQFIIRMNAEDTTFSETVEFHSDTKTLSTTPIMFEFTSSSIDWLIQPSGLFSLTIFYKHLGGQAFLHRGNYEYGSTVQLSSNLVSVSNVTVDPSGNGKGTLSDHYSLIQDENTVEIGMLDIASEEIVIREPITILNDGSSGLLNFIFNTSDSMAGDYTVTLIVTDSTTEVRLGPYQRIKRGNGDSVNSDGDSSVELGLALMIIVLMGLAVWKRDRLKRMFKGVVKWPKRSSLQ